LSISFIQEGLFFFKKKCVFFFSAISLLVVLYSSHLNAAPAENPSGFTKALLGYQYSFPRDHFSHDNFKLEWWYYTGNLKNKEGREFGFQLTFFRVALDRFSDISKSSRWRLRDIHFAHMTVSDIENEKFYFFERLNREGLGNAGAKLDQFLVWNEDWVLGNDGDTHDLTAIQKGFGLKLSLRPQKEMVFHGENGVSQKGMGNASHYFSYTRMKTSGKVYLKGEEFEVNGTSWMDREFSSSQLNERQVGWDWFSIKLDNQTELMIYRIRLKNGETEPYSSGTIVFKNGSYTHLELSDFDIRSITKWRSEKTGAVYPSSWSIVVPGHEIDLQVKPDFPNQELYGLRSIAGAYWEGSVSVRGKYKGKPINGKGYVELVGYDKALDTGPVK
jgi:predicted secreted hydrolase